MIPDATEPRPLAPPTNRRGSQRLSRSFSVGTLAVEPVGSAYHKVLFTTRPSKKSLIEKVGFSPRKPSKRDTLHFRRVVEKNIQKGHKVNPKGVGSERLKRVAQGLSNDALKKTTGDASKKATRHRRTLSNEAPKPRFERVAQQELERRLRAQEQFSTSTAILNQLGNPPVRDAFQCYLLMHCARATHESIRNPDVLLLLDFLCETGDVPNKRAVRQIYNTYLRIRGGTSYVAPKGLYMLRFDPRWHAAKKKVSSYLAAKGKLTKPNHCLLPMRMIASDYLQRLFLGNAPTPFHESTECEDLVRGERVLLMSQKPTKGSDMPSILKQAKIVPLVPPEDEKLAQQLKLRSSFGKCEIVKWEEFCKNKAEEGVAGLQRKRVVQTLQQMIKIYRAMEDWGERHVLKTNDLGLYNTLKSICDECTNHLTLAQLQAAVEQQPCKDKIIEHAIGTVYWEYLQSLSANKDIQVKQAEAILHNMHKALVAAQTHLTAIKHTTAKKSSFNHRWDPSDADFQAVSFRLLKQFFRALIPEGKTVNFAEIFFGDVVWTQLECKSEIAALATPKEKQMYVAKRVLEHLHKLWPHEKPEEWDATPIAKLMHQAAFGEGKEQTIKALIQEGTAIETLVEDGSKEAIKTLVKKGNQAAIRALIEQQQQKAMEALVEEGKRAPWIHLIGGFKAGIFGPTQLRATKEFSHIFVNGDQDRDKPIVETHKLEHMRYGAFVQHGAVFTTQQRVFLCRKRELPPLEQIGLTNTFRLMQHYRYGADGQVEKGSFTISRPVVDVDLRVGAAQNLIERFYNTAVDKGYITDDESSTTQDKVDDHVAGHSKQEDGIDTL